VAARQKDDNAAAYRTLSTRLTSAFSEKEYVDDLVSSQDRPGNPFPDGSSRRCLRSSFGATEDSGILAA